MKMEYTAQAKDVLDEAIQTAKSMKHNFVGTEHLLYALVKYQASSASMILL